MEPVIRKLIIQGFRSFRSEVVDFDNPTFLVGRNGSGKSNLIDAIAFLNQAMTTPLSDLISWKGGGRVVYHGSSTNGEHRTLGLGVVLGAISDEIATARYAFQVAATGARRPSYVVRREQCIVDRRDGRRDYFERNENESFRSNATGFDPQLAEDTLAIRLIGGDVRFAPVFRALNSMECYSINPYRLCERQDRDSSKVLDCRWQQHCQHPSRHCRKQPGRPSTHMRVHGGHRSHAQASRSQGVWRRAGAGVHPTVGRWSETFDLGGSGYVCWDPPGTGSLDRCLSTVDPVATDD